MTRAGQTEVAPSPACCPSWCTNRRKAHRAGWDYVHAGIDRSRTCTRPVGSTRTIDGAARKVGADRFEYYELAGNGRSGGHSLDRPRVVLDQDWLTPAAARRLAAQLVEAADICEMRPVGSPS